MTWEKCLRWMVYLAGGAYCALFLFAAYTRLVYPYEVEWNEGAVLDHAIRLLEGKPLYTAPSLDFAPFVYTPLYYIVVGVVMKLGGIGLWAGRAVSLAATLGLSVLIAAIIRRETRSSLLSFAGASLFLAFYHATGFFYDIVRMDMLAMFFAVASIYWALYVKQGYIVAAISLALAYFTKQQMVLFALPIALWLLLHDRKRGVWFTAVLASVLLLGNLLLNVWSHGWYRFYTLTVPGSKAQALFSWNDAFGFFPFQVFQTFAVSTVIIAAAAWIGGRLSWKARNPLLLLFLCYIGGLLSAAMSIGNMGGYKNVFIPFTTMIAIVMPIGMPLIVSRVSDSLSGSRQDSLLFRSSASLVMSALLLFQFAALAYNPFSMTTLFGSARQRAGGDELITTIRAMHGDVWIPMHGYLNRLAGKPTHIHFMAMNDALIPGDTTSKRFQREIDSAYSQHRFSAIILDEDKAFTNSTPSHYLFRNLIFQTPNISLSRIGDAPTRPQFVYTPDR